jgi:hypothetical protein
MIPIAFEGKTGIGSPWPYPGLGGGYFLKGSALFRVIPYC